MEKIIKKLFISGTLLVALAVSCTALTSSYAVDENKPPKDTTFELTIPEVVTLSKVDGVNIEQASLGTINEDNIVAEVMTNSNYQIQLSATTPDLKLNGDITSSQFIPATANVQAGVNGWGVKNANNIYDAVTTTPKPFYNGVMTGSTPASVNLPVGIGVAPTLPNGTYSTVVTLTVATQP